MFKPVSLLKEKCIEDPSADLRAARRVEQYRISDRALYIPNGLRWSYIPLDEIREAEPSHRVVSAGKCVSVDLRRPSVELATELGPLKLNLEREESMQDLLAAIRRRHKF